MAASTLRREEEWVFSVRISQTSLFFYFPILVVSRH